MFLMLLTSLLIFFVTFIMMLMASILSKKSFSDREKSSPFECGFDPKSSPRLPFSLQFFLIAVIFLIFDVEITLLIPLILLSNSISMMSFIILSNTFFFILIMGTYHEWLQGALNWSN